MINPSLMIEKLIQKLLTPIVIKIILDDGHLNGPIRQALEMRMTSEALRH